MATEYDARFFIKHAWSPQRAAQLTATAAALNESFRPASVLDIGCGFGELVAAFIHLGVNACGLDISSYATSHGVSDAQTFLHVTNVETDLFPFADDTFDLVVCLQLVEHLTGHDHLVSEMKRVLKPGGVV